MNSTDFSGQLLDFLHSRAHDTDQLVDLRYLPKKEPVFCEWPAFVAPKVKAGVASAIRGSESSSDALAGENLPEVADAPGWQLWSHQGEALEALHDGCDVFLSTGTGSGKSLVAWISALNAIANFESRRELSKVRGGEFADLFAPTTLYLAPTKALAADQFQQIHKLSDALPFEVLASVVDGDTDFAVKDWARSFSQILLTNPDYVHHALLAGHQRWSRFLRALRYVVVDEMHYWRGIRGAHLALLLRRLLRICTRLGASPQVIMLSATVQNPLEVAEKMTGRQNTVVIERDGSGFPGRYVVVWQPRVDGDSKRSRGGNAESFSGGSGNSSGFSSSGRSGSFDGSSNSGGSGSFGDLGRSTNSSSPSRSGNFGQTRVAAAVEAAEVMAGLVERGARVLTFVRSRHAAELVSVQVREHLSSSGMPDEAVLAYRGGYLPEERRVLECSLRSGQVQGLVTTSALELGIDISGLDATVTVGWPGSKASLWQQFGRCGRGKSPGVSVFIASSNPLDAYFVAHPEELFGVVESQVFEPTNPWILFPHVCAAAAEFPLTLDDLTVFDLPDERFLHQLVEDDYLRSRTDGWYWNVGLTLNPHQLTDLRGGGGQVQIVEQSSGALVGTISREQADLEVFPNAIYLHQGRAYRVLELVQDSSEFLDSLVRDSQVPPGFQGAGDSRELSGSAPGFAVNQGLALVEEVDTSLRTRAGQRTRVEILGEEYRWESVDGCVSWHFGFVQVASQVTDYDVLQFPGAKWVANYVLDLPVHKLMTASVWFELTSVGLGVLGLEDDDLAGTLHAVEHAMIGILPLLATCDRWDLGGLSTVLHAQTGVPTVFVHDAYRGGAGFAQTGFGRVHEWVQRTLSAVRNCSCASGCPSCIQSPKCGNRNEPLSKAGAIRLLEFLVERTPPIVRP